MAENIEKLKRENILYRWGLTTDELTQIVDNNPSLRGMMLGYVAEYKLRKMYFEDPRVSALIKDDDHDRKIRVISVLTIVVVLFDWNVNLYRPTRLEKLPKGLAPLFNAMPVIAVSCVLVMAQKLKQPVC